MFLTKSNDELPKNRQDPFGEPINYANLVKSILQSNVPQLDLKGREIKQRASCLSNFKVGLVTVDLRPNLYMVR